MADSRKIHLILCLPGISCSNLGFHVNLSMWLFKIFYWQAWNWHLL